MAKVLFNKNDSRFRLYSCNDKKNYNWLFFPGGPGCDSGYYENLIEILNLPGNIWLIDLPQNGSNTSGSNYDSEFDFEKWQSLFIDAMSDFDNAIYVGQSFSAKYALLHPDIEPHLKGAVLMNCSPGGWVDKAQNKGLAHSLPSFENELKSFLEVPTKTSFDKAMDKFVYYYFDPIHLEKDSAWLKSFPFNPYALHWWLKKAPSLNYEKIWIPKIPTLIMGGSNDCAAPFEGFKTDQRFKKENIILEEIEGAYHVPWLDKPQRVQKLFSQFLEKLECQA